MARKFQKPYTDLATDGGIEDFGERQDFMRDRSNIEWKSPESVNEFDRPESGDGEDETSASKGWWDWEEAERQHVLGLFRETKASYDELEPVGGIDINPQARDLYKQKMDEIGRQIPKEVIDMHFGSGSMQPAGPGSDMTQDLMDVEDKGY